MPRQVFISYAHADRTIAEMICRAVESSGLPCWIAPRDIHPGTSWSEGIIDGINQCEAMVLVFSSESNQSQQVVREIERAVHKNVSVIPFMIEDLPLSKSLEYYLNVVHWLKAFEPPMETHIQQLVADLKEQLVRDSSADAAASACGLDIARLPYSLATALTRYWAVESTDEPALKLREQALLIRNIVEYLGFVSISDYLRRIRPRLDAIDRDSIDVLINNSIGKPTLIDLARCCMRIPEVARRERLFLPHLFDFVFSDGDARGAATAAVVSDVQEAFDRSFCFDDGAECDSTCDRWGEYLESVLPGLQFLARYPLYFVEASREIGPGDFELDASFCTGIDAFDRKADVSVKLTSAADTGGVIVYNPYSKEALSLDPLVKVFPVCPCGQCSLVDQMGIYSTIGNPLKYRLISDPDHIVGFDGKIPLQMPHLVFSRTIQPSVLAPGETACISVTAFNAGSSPAREIRYSEELPEGLRLTEGNLNLGGGLDSGQSAETVAEVVVGDVSEVSFDPVQVSYDDDHLTYETQLPSQNLQISERTAPALAIKSSLSDQSTVRVNDFLRTSYEITNNGTTSALGVEFALELPDNLEFEDGCPGPEPVFDVRAGESRTFDFSLRAVMDGACTISTEPITYADTEGNSYTLDPLETKLLVEFKWRAGLSGRDMEIETLNSILDEAMSGRGHMVLISGSAGVGKTRLLAELERVAHDLGVLCLKGKCDAFASNMPFMPFKQIFSRGFDVEEELGNVEGGRKATVEIMRIAPSLEECIPMITKFLLDAPDDSSTALDPIAERERFFFAASELIEQFSKIRPMMFSIEDLQWADSGSLDFLQFLSHRLSGMPVLIVGTYRTEELTSTECSIHPLSRCMRQLSREHAYEEINLGELTEEDVHLMVSSIFYNVRFPSDFVPMLFRETEGNPLFIIEVLRSLHDQGIICREDGWWVLKETTTKIEMPETLEMVIKERLEKLEEDERIELQKASVIGREFTYKILHGLSECDEDELIDNLEEYVNLHIVEELCSDDESFSFTHGKIQEVVYGELMGLKRKRLHKKVAEIIEQIYAERLDEVVQLLAHHYYEAGNTEKALDYLIRAGEQCSSVYSMSEAEEHFSRALEILDGQPADPGLNIKKRNVLAQVASLNKHAGNYDRAEALYRQCLDLDVERGDEYERGWSLDNLGDIEVLRGDSQAAERLYKEVLDIARSAPDRTELESEILIDLGKLYFTLSQEFESSGELTQAQRACNKSIDALNCALKLASGLDDHSRIIRACRYLSDAYLLTNDFNRAIQYSERSLELAEEHGLLKLGHIPLGKVHCRLGDYASARSHFEMMRVWSSKSGMGRVQVIADKCLGAVCVLQGDPEGALEYLTEAQRLNETGVHKEIAPGILAFMGDAYLQLGREQDALNAFKEVASLKGLDDGTLSMGDLMVLAGFEFFGRGYYGKAIEYIESNAEVTKRAELLEELGAVLADSYLDYGKALEHLAEHEKAIDCYRAAVKIAREDGDFEREWWATDLLGDLFLKVGDFAASEDAYSACLSKATRSGNEELVREINMDLSELFATSADLTIEEGEGKVHSKSSELSKRAGEHARAALEMADSAGDLDCMHRAHQCLGYLAYQVGKLTEALEQAEAAEKIAREQFFELSVLGLLSRIYRRLGDLELAIKTGRNYLAWSEAVLDKEEQVRAATDLGIALLHNREIQEAESLLRIAEDLNRQARDVYDTPEIAIVLGEIDERKGNMEDAMLKYRAAATGDDLDGALAAPHEVQMQIGKLLFMREEYGQARFFFEKVVACEGIPAELTGEAKVFLADIEKKDDHDRTEAAAYLARSDR